jgi:hypothetical protein
VHWAAARDMKPGQLASMQATLAQWRAPPLRLRMHMRLVVVCCF